MRDFILNGIPNGSVATKLMACDFDVGALRPYLGKDGCSYVSITRNGKLQAIPALNADTTLRYDEWKLIDDAILRAARPRLKAVADLRAKGLQFTIPNGMAKTVLSTERMSDPGAAIVSMDALREGPNDRPVFDMVNLPLPIIHSDFSISSRQLAVSRNGNTPFDTVMGEACGRRIAEEAEKLLLGTSDNDAYSYGGGVLYGYTSFPNRVTHTITAPTAGGWTGATLLAEILAMRQLLYDAFHYGPYMLYNSPAWDAYLDDDFKAASDKTIRQRVKELAGVQDIQTLDYMAGFDFLMVEMAAETIREVIGMEITTVQWETHGGLKVNFKVMAIMVPQLRCDKNSNCGLLHASV